MAGEGGAWGRDSQGTARHARPAPRLGSFAHGLSPLPRAASSLNSFGLDDERECAHVRACVCVGVPRRVSGFSPRLVTSSVHSPRAAACGRGRPRSLLTPPMAAQGGREGGEDGRGGGHRVTREMLPLQIVISHRSGSPAKGRAPGSPVLSRAMQIVGAGRRLSQWGAGGGPQGLASKVSWNTVCVWGSLFSKVVTVTGAQEPRRLWAPRSEPPAPSGTAPPGSVRLGA